MTKEERTDRLLKLSELITHAQIALYGCINDYPDTATYRQLNIARACLSDAFECVALAERFSGDIK